MADVQIKSNTQTHNIIICHVYFYKKPSLSTVAVTQMRTFVRDEL